MKAAAVQFCPVFKDKASNLRGLARWIIRAAEAGAKLIVLPELCTTGYSFMSAAEAEPFADVLSEFVPEPHLRASSSMNVMYLLAHRYHVHVAWGLVEKDAGTGQLYNSQVLMCPDGRYESMRKINRCGNDFLWSRPGRANPPILICEFDGKPLKVGLLICRDVRDKKDDHWDSFYEKGDADVVVFSANWGKGFFPATTWMDFVEDNNTTLVVSNRFGKETANDYGDGGVCIIHPPDKVACEGLVWGKDCVVYAEIGF